jgi:phosphodiesterase/alkaline phosphatase D-like protein
MASSGLNRREVLEAGALAGAALALGRVAGARASAGWSETVDFTALGTGDGWPGWHCAGVANLRRDGTRGLLEAGSDVFPCDPRPVAFALDRRFRDGAIAAVVDAAGAGAGLVLRRVGPREYYAAIYDDEQRALLIVRRSPGGVTELARAAVAPPDGALQLSFSARGTALEAALDTTRLTANDATPALQRAGDPGVLATARTLFPSAGPAVLPALGNLHLLPYGVQEGEAFMNSAVGQEVLARIRERSTAAFATIVLRSPGPPSPTLPSVVAATTGTPRAGGATLRVATDVPARVELEVATNPRFHRSRRVRAGITGAFDSVLADVAKLPPGRRVYWRARLRRRRHESIGPVRSFKVLPRAGSAAPVTIAIAACASQFGPAFDQLIARAPDVFVWQGDLNYPDTIGPLAQTVPAYAGIWRDFLANPRLAPVLERAPFAAQRDDHDYGVQDANSTNLVPWGIAPWEGLIERRLYYRFSAGLADIWVLDQRRFKSDPTLPDTTDKTLLGKDQRDWLLRTLATSRAPFKVICSPCTVAPLPANGRDGSWATGFTAERDLLLAHIAHSVSGRTIFVTGDTHWTMAYENDGLFEARPCPLGIPTPNDITLTDPQAADDARKTPGVLYADDTKSHFGLIELSAQQTTARLELLLVREDGAVPFRRRFEQPRKFARGRSLQRA